MRSRRTVLTGIGGVMGTTALAGCSASDGNGDDTSAPEEAVGAFFEAVFTGDVETANENLHPESVDYPIDSEHQLVGDEGFSLVSIKGSFGRVPVYPDHRDPDVAGGNGWESLEHIGPITRTVADSALLMDVMAGPYHMDRHSLPDDGTEFLASISNPNVSGLRVAYSQDWGHAAVDSRVREHTAEAASVFEDLGCTVEHADPGFGDFVEAFTAIVANDTDLAGLRDAHERGELDEDLLINIIETEWDVEDFTNAKKARQRLNMELRRFMEDYDLLLTPTLAVPPFDLDSPGPTEIEGREVPLFHWLSFTFPLNMTGHPAATVPAGWTDDGLPIGLQLIGTHLDDQTVIEASAAYESANSWTGRYFPDV